MSTQKKQKEIITNQQLFLRLHRLPIVKQLPVDDFAAFIGLHLVNHGNVIPVAKALRIIHKSKLNKKIKHNGIPCVNHLEALIYITIYKRKLVTEIVTDEDADIWNDEITAPLFDMMKTIMEIYKI